MIDVDVMQRELNIAYGQLGDNRVESFVAWETLTQKWGHALMNHHQGEGFTAAQAHWDRLYLQVLPPCPVPERTPYMLFMRAMAVDYTQRFLKHILDRLEAGGNLVLEITGYTGYGKSSCAISLSNWILPIDPAQLQEFLAYHLGEVLQKSATKKPGQTIICDEGIRPSGEGSRTLREAVSNFEETTRASQVNLLWISPSGAIEHTSQGQLRVLLWNPQGRATRFMYWLDEAPLGYVTLAWAPDPLYGAYKPWKHDTVQKSLRGAFRGKSRYAAMMMEFLETPGVYEFFTHGERPLLTTIQQCYNQYYEGNQPASDALKFCRFMYSCFYNFDKTTPERFQATHGVAPSEKFVAVAKRCRRERA